MISLILQFGFLYCFICSAIMLYFLNKYYVDIIQYFSNNDIMNVSFGFDLFDYNCPSMPISADEFVFTIFMAINSFWLLPYLLFKKQTTI